jgi:hypothetical protein
MRMCAELAGLGMDLARAAAAKTLADWAKPEEPPEAEHQAEPPPEPERAASTRPAAAAKPPRAPGTSVRASKPADPATIFTRLVACVCSLIALEGRLAAGLTPNSRGTSPALRADPRRAPLHDIFRRITQHDPDRAELVRQTTARIDENLAADPDQEIELPELFFAICEDFGIEVDLARLPDKFLGLAEDPDPRATSPP